MKNRSRGMTLIELMTALSVVGVLIAIAVPGFQQFTAGARGTAATNDLVTALNLARSEALRRANNVAVCASADPASCSGSGNWATGWVVFSDPNRNGAVDAGELIQVWAPSDGGLDIVAKDPVNAAVGSVVYDATGMGSLPGGAKVTFSVTPHGCKGDRAGTTEVSMAGTIHSSKVACP